MTDKAFTERSTDRLSDLASISFQSLERNVKDVLYTLHKNVYQNSEPAKLVAVTKTVPPQVISALGTLGIQDIGENRVQVALPKLLQIDEISKFRLHWIGRLQRNKVKDIIDKVWLLHSLDRLSLAQEVERRAAQSGRVIPALVQINIAQESQKSGVSADDVLSFLRQMKDFRNIRICGLMAMMPLTDDNELPYPTVQRHARPV